MGRFDVIIENEDEILTNICDDEDEVRLNLLVHIQYCNVH